MHRVEARGYGYTPGAVAVGLEVGVTVLGTHIAAAEGRARQIDHIHHAGFEVQVKQLGQSFVIEEREKRIYRNLVLVGRGIRIDHMTVVAVEERIAVAGGILLVKVRSQVAETVVVAVADPGKTGESDKMVGEGVVGIAGIGSAVEEGAAK